MMSSVAEVGEDQWLSSGLDEHLGALESLNALHIVSSPLRPDGGAAGPAAGTPPRARESAADEQVAVAQATAGSPVDAAFESVFLQQLESQRQTEGARHDPTTLSAVEGDASGPEALMLELVDDCVLGEESPEAVPAHWTVELRKKGGGFGMMVSDTATVVRLLPERDGSDGPAAEQGVLCGMRIAALDGAAVHSKADLLRHLGAAPDAACCQFTFM